MSIIIFSLSYPPHHHLLTSPSQNPKVTRHHQHHLATSFPVHPTNALHLASSPGMTSSHLVHLPSPSHPPHHLPLCLGSPSPLKKHPASMAYHNTSAHHSRDIHIHTPSNSLHRMCTSSLEVFSSNYNIHEVNFLRQM